MFLSPESTETPRPLLVKQDTISNTSGTATVHTSLHEIICVRNGRKCTCDSYRPPMFERYILENPASFRTFKKETGFLTYQGTINRAVLW